MMKRLAWIVILLLALAGLLTACGGGSEAPAQPAAQNQANSATEVETSATPASEDAAAELPTEPPAAEEPAAEDPAGGGDISTVAGLAASGTDPESGLEINPASIVPGVDYLVRGELVSVNLTPPDSPEFLILSPAGVRYRIHTQALAEIFFDDGTQPAPHEYKRGMLAQATVRQEEGAGATIEVDSSDFMLLHPTE